MGRRGIDVLLIVAVVSAAFVVWIGGLGLAAAGLALDHPPCVRSHEDCGSSTFAWSWFPPGRRYEWVGADGAVRSAIDPWDVRPTDSWAWTVIVLAIAAAAIVAILRRGRSSIGRRLPWRHSLRS